jgi:hypothetical protein
MPGALLRCRYHAASSSAVSIDVVHSSHAAYRHPPFEGASVSSGWSGLKPGSDPWRGLLAQTGWTKKDVERLYWASR